MGVELIYYDKATTRNSIKISYALLFSTPYQTPNYYYSTHLEHKENRLTLTLDIDILNDGELTIKSHQAERVICGREELEKNNSLFQNILENNIVTWASLYRSKDKINNYLKSVLHPQSAYWITREEFGNEHTKQQFLEYMRANPYTRTDERLTSWLEAYKIISSDIKRRLDRASGQAYDRVPEFMKEVLIDIENQKTQQINQPRISCKIRN